MSTPITRRQFGAAILADQILRQKSRYMIVTTNVKGKLVFFDPYEGSDPGPFPFLSVSTNDATAVYTTLREAERALNIVKALIKMHAGDLPKLWRGLDKECVDAIGIVRLNIDVEPVKQRSHQKKAKAQPFVGSGWPERGYPV